MSSAYPPIQYTVLTECVKNVETNSLGRETEKEVTIEELHTGHTFTQHTPIIINSNNNNNSDTNNNNNNNNINYNTKKTIILNTHTTSSTSTSTQSPTKNKTVHLNSNIKKPQTKFSHREKISVMKNQLRRIFEENKISVEGIMVKRRIKTKEVEDLTVDFKAKIRINERSKKIKKSKDDKKQSSLLI